MSSSLPSHAVRTVLTTVLPRGALLVVIGLIPVTGLQAAIPPGATPGGAQPTLPAARPVLPDLDQETFSIPPVFERPLGVDEGDRVFVRGFVLTGIVDDADAGIDASEVEQRVQQRFSELQRLLESLRVEKQQQTEVDADGFTPEERQRILSFIRDVVGNLEADAQVDAYQGFVNELRLQRLQRDQGMTIGQIALVAEEVTKYYRDRGYILARAIVPAQEVVDGIVTIHVLEGRLAQVTPQNNVRYDSEAITAPFDAALGKLVTVERMEQGLLTLGKYPGMLATGVFRPGPSVGTTEMILNVQREDPFGWSARTDNHGSTFTGRYRLLFDFAWNSPSGDGDLLYGSVLKSLQPDAALYGSVRYEAPFPDPSYRWGVDISQNAFDAFDPEDGSPLASGASYNGKLYLEHYTRLSRTAKSWFTLDLTRKRSESLDFDTDIVNTRDDLAVLGLQFNRENIDGKAQVITSGFFRADKGLASLFGVPSEEEAQDPNRSPGYSRANGPAVRFIKYSFGYSMLKVLGPTQTLVLRGSGNYSTDYLVAVEQFNMGGPSNVRGANVSAALRDKGIFGSVEWNIRAPGFADKPAWWGDQPWGRTLGVTLFYDHAIGWQNRTPSEDQVKTFTNTKIEMNGLGFGVDLALPWGIGFKTQVAKLVSGRDGGADPAAIEDTTQVWFEFSRSF